MGFIRHQNNSNIQIPFGMDAAFPAFVKACGKVGKVKNQSKLTGTIVVRTPMKLFPPQNPATVRISLMGNEAQTNISFNSESADGAIGFGSAGKAIDKIIEEVEKYL
ncbi:hypothetical protein N9B36_01710 [Akkermansiaceae bacterium]|nr:hypothetical protein [Akkermansiaceae bacterium]|tara:strand:+ start:259 stop:579 length:321 start_codon:yes stop_codon:yes gene_type:complete